MRVSLSLYSLSSLTLQEGGVGCRGGGCSGWVGQWCRVTVSAEDHPTNVDNRRARPNVLAVCMMV